MNRGVSLLETILAGFIISLVTMAVFNIFPTSAMAVKRGEMQLLADAIAERELEQLRVAPFDSLALGPGPAVAPETRYGTTFNTAITISRVPGSDEDVLKRATVVVTWTHSNKNYTSTREAWLVSVET